MIMEKGTLILIVCVIFGLGLFMVSKLGCFIKESRKELSDERSNLQLLKKVEMSSKGRQKNADMHVIPGTVMPETGQKQKFKLHIETPSVKDYILTVYKGRKNLEERITPLDKIRFKQNEISIDDLVYKYFAYLSE